MKEKITKLLTAALGFIGATLFIITVYTLGLFATAELFELVLPANYEMSGGLATLILLIPIAAMVVSAMSLESWIKK